jgi:hypothetical protein
MATPIIVKPTRPAEIIVGKGQTAGSPIFVPSTGGGGGTGGEASPALDELFGLPENVPQLVIGSDTEVCRALQDIVPSMDLSISAEQAAGFTAQTQALVEQDPSIGESVEQGNGSDLEQFFGVVEPKDCQWMTTDEVCAALEQIMQSIDPELTASMAQSITQSITQA